MTAILGGGVARSGVVTDCGQRVGDGESVTNCVCLRCGSSLPVSSTLIGSPGVAAWDVVEVGSANSRISELREGVAGNDRSVF